MKHWRKWTAIVLLILTALLLACATTPKEQPAQIEPPPATEEAPAAPEAPPEKPALTPAEEAYVIFYAKHNGEVDDAVAELMILLGVLRKASNRNFSDIDWILKTTAWLATIRTLYDEALEVEPPDSMTHIHSKYIQSLEPLNTMAKRLPQEIDKGNPDLLNDVSTEIETWGDLSTEAQDLILEFTGLEFLEFRETYK